MARRDLKITIVGDGYVGKTCLLISYKTKKPPADEYIPTVFDNYDEEYIFNGNIYNMSLWDTAGQEGYDKLRVLSYPNTDCFILCYAINGDASFVNVRQKWLPELRKHRPHTPIALVATKCDLRNVDDPNLVLISVEQGIELAKEIKAAVYFECSAQDMVGVDEVIEAAVKASLKLVHVPKKRTCVIL